MISVRDSLIQLHEQQDLSLNAIVPNFFKQHTFKLLGLSILGYVSYKIWKRPRNLPPGPINWPIQTAIEQPDSWHIDFVRLGRQYGDVFSFYYGSRFVSRAVVVYIDGFELWRIQGWGLLRVRKRQALIEPWVDQTTRTRLNYNLLSQYMVGRVMHETDRREPYD